MFVPAPLSPRRPSLTVAVRIDPTGRTGPTRRQARGPHWRRVWHGYYLPAASADSVDQRIAQCAPLLGEGDAVTGWAALRWWGATAFAGRAPIPLVVAGRRGPQAGLTLSQEALAPTDVVMLDGLRVTTPVRSVLFAMRHASTWRRAVEVCDLALGAGLVQRRELARAAERLGGWTGIPQARRALEHVDAASGCVAETRMRLVWTDDARLPRPLVRHPVFDATGRLLGTPALFDPRVGLIGECVAEPLRAPGPRDTGRLAAYRAAGLETVVATSDDLAHPWPFIRRLREAHGRASAQRGPRRWRWEAPTERLTG